MKPYGSLGYYYNPPDRSSKRTNRRPEPRQKTDLEKAQEQIEQLTQVKEGHELRIEYLESVVAALCAATGVSVPEPPGL